MRRKSLLLLTAKLVFSAALLWLVLRKVDVRDIFARLSTADASWISLAVLIGLIVAFLSAWRWRVLSLGLLGFGEAVRYTWIGLFFGSITPGIVGGDVAKGISLATKESRARDPRLPVSIIVDKLVGFWVLLLQFIVVATMMLAAQPRLLAGARGALWAAAGATAAGLLAAAAVCHPRGMAWLTAAAVRLPISGLRHVVIRALTAFGSYRGHGRALMEAALISVPIHALNVFTFWIVMHSVAIPASLSFAAVFYPMLSVLLVLPVSVSGVGVRDVFAASMFTAFGLNPESGIAASWLLLGVTIPNAAIGGWIQLWEVFRRQSDPSARSHDIPSPGVRDGRPAIRICHVIDSLGRGGTQRCLVQLVQGLAGRGYQQWVICLNNDVDPEIHAQLSAVAPVTVVGRVSLITGWGILRLVWFFRRERIEIAQTYLRYADTIGRITARLANVPCILSSVRARNVDKRVWHFWLDRLTIRWVHNVIFNNQRGIAFSVASEGVPPDRAIFIPNGVETGARLPAPDRALFEAAALPPQARLIVSVGRLNRQKGHDVLIHAFIQIARRHPDVFLVIIGDGPERRALEKLARTLSARIVLLGERNDVKTWLAASEVFALASRFEGMPNAVMEAMAAGLPIVATDIDGTSDLVTDGVTGLLVSPDDEHALAGALDRLLSMPGYARAFGTAGQSLMAGKYSVSQMVERYDEVYRTTLDVCRATRSAD